MIKYLNDVRQGRQPVKLYCIWLVFYLVCSLLGQYGCTISIDLSYLFGEGWWIPLGVITIVPMVDISRSYAQHYAEKAQICLNKSLILMLLSTLIISLVFSIYGNLPVSICLATFFAVNIGGVVDMAVFRVVKRISPRAYIRMRFSNLAATLTGGGVFYIIAYSDFLERITKIIGIDFNNNVYMDNLFKGWLLQSAFIWGAGLIIATSVGRMIEVYENSSDPVKESGAQNYPIVIPAKEASD